jgi:hypothetical protein
MYRMARLLRSQSCSAAQAWALMLSGARGQCAFEVKCRAHVHQRRTHFTNACACVRARVGSLSRKWPNGREQRRRRERRPSRRPARRGASQRANWGSRPRAVTPRRALGATGAAQARHVAGSGAAIDACRKKKIVERAFLAGSSLSLSLSHISNHVNSRPTVRARVLALHLTTGRAA